MLVAQELGMENLVPGVDCLVIGVVLLFASLARMGIVSPLADASNGDYGESGSSISTSRVCPGGGACAAGFGGDSGWCVGAYGDAGAAGRSESSD